MKKNYRIIMALFLSVSIFLSCATNKHGIRVEKLDSANDFMKANVPLISEYTLDNGIKVVIKKQESNRIFTMAVLYKGGVALLPEGKDGLESLTMETMLRGSKKYSYEDIKRIFHEKSASMSFNNTLDASTFNVVSIDKYWDEIFDVFSDAVLNPRFEEQQFALVKHSRQMALKKAMSDPYRFTVMKLHERTFAEHPYQRQDGGTPESIKNIGIDDLKAWHKEQLSADRMTIVAVGNFNIRKLLKQLNASFGRISQKDRNLPDIPRLAIPAKVYTEVFPQSKGIAYIRGDYSIPAVGTADFRALQLAYSILGELLFEIVRTQKAACYSVWANGYAVKASYGSFVIFKSDKATLAKKAYDQAIALLASGKTINLKGQGIKTGEGRQTKGSGKKYAPIAENLEAYKAKYINSFYSKQRTNVAAVSQILGSEVYAGNSYEYLKFIDETKAITAEDIIRVTNKYIVHADISWMIVADKATLSTVDKKVFKEFTATVEN